MHQLRGGRALVCAACARRFGGPALAMSPGARRYLAYTMGLDLARGASVSLAGSAARSLRRLSAMLVESVLEEPLKTLEAGAGIL